VFFHDEFTTLPHGQTLLILVSSHSCPYVQGSDVTLTLTNTQVVGAKILDAKARTLSCVMTVQLTSSSEVYILKLYDRRFSEQLRRDENTAVWDSQLERRYRDFVRAGHSSRLFELWSAAFREDQYYEDEQRDRWDEAIFETYLQFLCQQAYEMETHAYNLLHDLQGHGQP
jgi:hypothetical protein